MNQDMNVFQFISSKMTTGDAILFWWALFSIISFICIVGVLTFIRHKQTIREYEAEIRRLKKTNDELIRISTARHELCGELQDEILNILELKSVCK